MEALLAPALIINTTKFINKSSLATRNTFRYQTNSKLIRAVVSYTMDDFWWAGVVFSGIFMVLGSIGNGLTIGVFIKFSHFQNPLGFLVLR
jgi:hypothetical protein